MKKITVLLLLCIGFSAFAQDLSRSQVRINNTVFTIGVNKYSTDYELIFNKWYQGHTSSSDVKRGESLNWVNAFTGKYSIKSVDYDVTINRMDAGKSLHGILFSGGGVGFLPIHILFIYDATGILRYVEQSLSDMAFRPVPLLNRDKIFDRHNGHYIPTKDTKFFQDGFLTEPRQDLTGLTGLKISALSGTVLSEAKSAYDWVVSYEARTGKYPPNEADRFTGLEYQESSIRIAKEQAEANRLQREEQTKFDRLQREEQARLEQEEREEATRIAREKIEQERLTAEQKRMEKEKRESEEQQKITDWQDWQQAVLDQTITVLVVNDGSKDNSIIVGKTKTREVLNILERSFSNHGKLGEYFRVKDETYYYSIRASDKYGNYGQKNLLNIYIKKGVVAKIELGERWAERPNANLNFFGGLYGILTVIPNGIKLW